MSIINRFNRIIVGLNLMLTYNVFAQDYPVKPTLDHQQSWSMIVIPDIQNYAKFKQNQPILDLMNRWIEANIDPLNIKMIVCVGDLVEQNNVLLTGENGDLSSKEQWKFVQQSFSLFNHKVPYILATGNHDYSIDMTGQRFTQYDNYFFIEDNSLNKKHLVQYGFDERQQPTLSNSFYEFKDLNGIDYLVVNLEYAPTNATLNWANRILSFDEYKNHEKIILTHAYLNRNDQHLEGENKWLFFNPYFINGKLEKTNRIVLPNSNNGKQIWEKLIKPNQNVQLVLSGHISGEGFRVDINDHNQKVNQMLFDMQSEGGGHNGNGGDGFLRILEFYPDNKTIKVKTFSPLFALSPKTKELAYKKDDRNDFIITK